MFASNKTLDSTLLSIHVISLGFCYHMVLCLVHHHLIVIVMFAINFFYIIMTYIIVYIFFHGMFNFVPFASTNSSNPWAVHTISNKAYTTPGPFCCRLQSTISNQINNKISDMWIIVLLLIQEQPKGPVQFFCWCEGAQLFWQHME